MSGSKYSPEFKNQVVLEVVDKHRTIKAVAESYNLVAQTVGVWVKEYRKKNPDPETENLTSAESAELERLRKDLREARMENEFLKKAAAFFAKESQELSATRTSSRKKATTPFGSCADASPCLPRDIMTGEPGPAPLNRSRTGRATRGPHPVPGWPCHHCPARAGPRKDTRVSTRPRGSDAAGRGRARPGRREQARQSAQTLRAHLEVRPETGAEGVRR
ncbi:Transposase IS3/IS911 family protein [Propionibacterium freudenreichii]|nr:Transposase IS3/IS911 family protein [Propionibacterium freudenreichii]